MRIHNVIVIIISRDIMMIFNFTASVLPFSGPSESEDWRLPCQWAAEDLPAGVPAHAMTTSRGGPVKVTIQQQALFWQHV